MCGFEDGVAYPGLDLKYVSVKDHHECSDHCVDEHACVGFTFNKKNKKCWMKWSLNDGVYDKDCISGYCAHNRGNGKLNNIKNSNDNSWNTHEKNI